MATASRTPPARPVRRGLDTPIGSSGLPSAALLRRVGTRLGIAQVRDLLFMLPRDYQDLRELRIVADLQAVEPGEVVTVKVEVVSIRTEHTMRRRVQHAVAVVRDATGEMDASWFGRRYIERRLAVGQEVLMTGKVRHRGWRPAFEDPEFQAADAPRVHSGGMRPVYRLTAGLSARQLRSAMRAALDRFVPDLADYLPSSTRGSHPGLEVALEHAHFPTDPDLKDAALLRLAFDELLALQVGMVSRRRTRHLAGGTAITVSDGRYHAAIASLEVTLDALVAARRPAADARGEPWPPVRFTPDQLGASDAIRADLARDQPMLRLLQGDVGSGKTAVAALAMMIVADAGAQSAILAPTDLLARQHARTLSRLMEPLGHDVVLLTASLPIAERREALEVAQRPVAATIAGRSRGLVFVGTHALVADAIAFADLRLAVVDEQHRFGVAERDALAAKGTAPHVLLMTATPIPQVLAQVLYADLDVSDLRAAPIGRLPTGTGIRPSDALERTWQLVRAEAAAGHRSFVVVPLIEGSPDDLAISAEAEAVRLRELLAPLQVGLVHGRLRAPDREAVMAAFRDGELDVLVGTTVVEVGVDVPEATLMIIEGADRFGLAQLHQLRGRVGRGDAQSYCVLVSDAAADSVAMARLEAVRRTRDGFALAEADFALRQEGEALGLRQSGLPPLRAASLRDPRHRSLVGDARALAEEIVDQEGRIRADHARFETELRTGWLARLGAGDVLRPEEIDG